jgi:hypothetical protein
MLLDQLMNITTVLYSNRDAYTLVSKPFNSMVIELTQTPDSDSNSNRLIKHTRPGSVGLVCLAATAHMPVYLPHLYFEQLLISAPGLHSFWSFNYNSLLRVLPGGDS